MMLIVCFSVLIKFEPVDETLECEHPDENYCPVCISRDRKLNFGF